MIRHRFRSIRTLLALGLVVGVVSGSLAAAAMDLSGGASGTPSLAADAQPNATEASIDVAINCTLSQVNLTAPPEREYRVAVAVVNTTPTTSDTRRTTAGPLTGNATVNVTGTGAVFAFVWPESDRPQSVARAFAHCDRRDETNADAPTPDPSADGVPSIRVNCTGEIVRFTAPVRTQYVASVTVVEVSPTQSSVTRQTRTFTGNATLPVQTADGVVAAFAARESLDDETRAFAVRDCGPPSQSATNSTSRTAS